MSAVTFRKWREDVLKMPEAPELAIPESRFPSDAAGVRAELLEAERARRNGYQGTDVREVIAEMRRITAEAEQRNPPCERKRGEAP